MSETSFSPLNMVHKLSSLLLPCLPFLFTLNSHLRFFRDFPSDVWMLASEIGLWGVLLLTCCWEFILIVMCGLSGFENRLIFLKSRRVNQAEQWRETRIELNCTIIVKWKKNERRNFWLNVVLNSYKFSMWFCHQVEWKSKQQYDTCSTFIFILFD